MSEFEARLADGNLQVLYKQAVGAYTIEVVDDCLTPTVKVADGVKTSTFPLERIGVLYSDGDHKFYAEASGDEIPTAELNDLAIEAHFRGEE